MLQLLYTSGYLGLLYITPCSAFVSMVSVCVPLASCMFMFSCTCTLTNPLSWYSDDNLVIQRCIGGAQGEGLFWWVGVAEHLGLCLGDIRFTEIQTTIKMHMVHLSTFLRFVEQGSFNADNLPLDGCSQTTAILLAFIPDRRLEDIESIAIGNVIRRCGSPLGDISSINMVIESIRSILDTEHKKSPLKCRAYMMLIGNYGGHMAFATDPPYCVAYATDYKNTMILPKWHHVNP